MPAISSINLTNGIKIDGVGIPSVNLPVGNFPSSGTLAVRETYIQNLIQAAYEQSFLVSSLTPDEGARQKPPILKNYERIETIGGKTYLIRKLMFISFHLFSMSPWNYTIRCSDEPIIGEWWL